jgi:YggT family protein
MSALSVVFRLLGAATSIYMLLCIVRIFLSWFPAAASGRPAEIVGQVTEPYLSMWRHIPFLVVGGVDFSPIAALAVLSGVSRVFAVASYGAVTIGLILSLLIEVVWGPVSFLLGFFMMLIVARIIAYAARWNSLHPIWRAIDSIINPVLFRLKRLVYKDRIVNYMQGLITGALLLLGARVVLGTVFGFIMRWFKTF